MTPFLESNNAMFAGHKPLYEVEELTKPLAIPKPKNAVAVIRNPVDRIISCANYFKTNDFHDHKYGSIEDVNELSYLLMNEPMGTDEMFPFLPQVHYLKGSLPIKLFLFDRINEVFSHLDLPVRHDNKSKRYYHKENMLESTLIDINNHYAEDLKLYERCKNTNNGFTRIR